jgi:hypothetical protein
MKEQIDDPFFFEARLLTPAFPQLMGEEEILTTVQLFHL